MKIDEVSDLSVMYRADVDITRRLCRYQYARYSQSANYASFVPNAPVSQSPQQPEDYAHVALSVCSHRPHARGANIEHCTTLAHSVLTSDTT